AGGRRAAARPARHDRRGARGRAGRAPRAARARRRRRAPVLRGRVRRRRRGRGAEHARPARRSVRRAVARRRRGRDGLQRSHRLVGPGREGGCRVRDLGDRVRGGRRAGHRRPREHPHGLVPRERRRPGGRARGRRRRGGRDARRRDPGRRDPPRRAGAGPARLRARGVRQRRGHDVAHRRGAHARRRGRGARHAARRAVLTSRRPPPAAPRPVRAGRGAVDAVGDGGPAPGGWAVMSRPPRPPPRWVRWTLAVLLALAPCVVWGVTTATAERSLGPHEARYEVTTNDLVTVDLGPLGTIQIRSPLPLGLGVDVTVEEIPADLTAVGQADTLEGLTQDLEDYLRFFGGPQETISSVTRALVADALRRTGFAIVVVALAGGGLYLLLGASRRRELSERVAPRTYEITASVVLVSLVAASLAASDPGTTRGPSQRASVVFDGTPLEGARITGRLAGVVDTYGAMLIDLYRENEDFYARANANLEAAWERREHIQRLTRPRLDAVPASDDSTDAPTGDGTATGGDEAPPAGADDTGTTGGEGATGDETTDEGATGADATGDATDDGATGGEDAGDPDGEASGDRSGDDEEPTPEPAAEEDLVTLLVVSDLHCNTGMAPLI